MSSFFDDASLVMIPSGYKDQKVYSVKPLDGSGDLTFSRASGATRVASNGLIEKVRTNLLAYSEQFDNAYWGKSNVTVTANSTVNPVNGATTAETLTRTVGASGFLNKQIAQTGIVTFSVFAKAGSTNLVRLNTYDGSTDRGATYNLTTGAITSVYGSPLFTLAQSFGNGWYRISIAVTAASYIDSQIHIDSLNSVIIFGAQLETGDIATDYIATTSAAVSVGPVSGLPRLDYLNSSCPRLLLEHQRTNSLTYSEQFDNAAWTKVRSSITSNNTTSPAGYTDADLLVADTSLNDHFTLRSATASTAQSFSVFAKAGGYNYVFVGSDNVTTSGVFFNLTNGTISQNTSTLTAKIEDYGNGWYRCAVSSASWPAAFALIATSANGTALVHTGDGTSGVYIWGAQLEAGAYATSYIPTLGAAVTRGADSFSLASLQTNGIIGSTGLSFFLNFRKRNLASLAAKPSLASAGDLDVIGISTTATTLVSSVRIGGGGFTNTTILSPYNNQMVKVCFTLSGTTLKVFVNGSLSLTTTASSSSVFSQLTTTTALDKDQEYEQILLFPTPLSDADAIALTA